MTNQQILIDAIKMILELTPKRPFLCLQLSAMLYAELEKFNLKPKLITGSLSYKNELLFNIDYSLNNTNTDSAVITGDWGGHAWIELDDLIIDLTICRTIYSDKFNKKCKTEIIQRMGEGRGCLIIDKSNNLTGFEYITQEELNDQIINGILKGTYLLLKETSN